MSIDTPSDEFYTINTNQSGPPMSARHKLLPRLLRLNPNKNLIHFPRNQPDRNGLVLYTYQDIYIHFGVKSQKMLYRSTMLKPFKSSSLQEIYMKLHFCMMNMKIHRLIPHHPMKMMSFKNARNSILTKIWSHPQMISWIS